MIKRFLGDSSPSTLIGAGLLAIIVACALLSPVIAPYGETELVAKHWLSPSADHWLGTDHLGRDMFTRLLYGGRTTILIALAITLLSFVVGIAVGFAAAVLGGWFDQAISRFIDVLMAVPTLILALLVLSGLGPSIINIILVSALLDATRVFRLARALAMDINVMDFVEVARLRGEKLGWIMRREILPNAIQVLIAEFGLRFCFAFLFVSALSFIGLGIQPPEADWGSMVRETARAIIFGVTAPLFPAGAIAVVTIAVNLLVDRGLARANNRTIDSNRA